MALGEAAAARRVGETALLAIAVLGGDGPANVPSLVLARAIEALRTVGLDADARALAVEGAILSGL